MKENLVFHKTGLVTLSNSHAIETGSTKSSLPISLTTFKPHLTYSYHTCMFNHCI